MHKHLEINIGCRYRRRGSALKREIWVPRYMCAQHIWCYCSPLPAELSPIPLMSQNMVRRRGRISLRYESKLGSRYRDGIS